MVHGFIGKETPAGRDGLARLIGHSHFLVLPTLADCFGLVLREANAFGVPCLANDVADDWVERMVTSSAIAPATAPWPAAAGRNSRGGSTGRWRALPSAGTSTNCSEHDPGAFGPGRRYIPMPKMVWTTFVARYPGGHLVAATVPIGTDQDIGTRHLKDLHAQLSRLVTRLAPVGDYAVAIVRDAGPPEIHAAFAERRDADRLAATVKARPTGRYPEWGGSRRLFVLDEPTGAAIAASLATDGELDER